MDYNVKLLFRDGITHYIETMDLEESRTYLDQIYSSMVGKDRRFRMMNKSNQIVYTCNMDNFIHAMIIKTVNPNPTTIAKPSFTKTVDMV